MADDLSPLQCRKSRRSGALTYPEPLGPLRPFAGYLIIRMEEKRIPKKGPKPKFPHCETSGKTKNQMGGCGSQRCLTIAGDKGMEE